MMETTGPIDLKGHGQLMLPRPPSHLFVFFLASSSVNDKNCISLQKERTECREGKGSKRGIISYSGN